MTERKRVMGLDLGQKRIGVAMSDALGIARPLMTLRRTGRREDLRSILRLARRHGCEAIVAGDPVRLSGEESGQTRRARAFVKELRAEAGIPVVLWDERLTTWEAGRHPLMVGRSAEEKKALVDQVAAVVMLQGWLDRQDEVKAASGEEHNGEGRGDICENEEEFMAENPDGVVVLYTAKAKPGKERELREMLVGGVTGSRHDQGNIAYEVHEVVGDPTTLVIYEQWISQEALDKHLGTPPLQKFIAKADELMEGGFKAGMRELKKLRPAPQG